MRPALEASPDVLVYAPRVRSFALALLLAGCATAPRPVEDVLFNVDATSPTGDSARDTGQEASAGDAGAWVLADSGAAPPPGSWSAPQRVDAYRGRTPSVHLLSNGRALVHYNDDDSGATTRPSRGVYQRILEAGQGTLGPASLVYTDGTVSSVVGARTWLSEGDTLLLGTEGLFEATLLESTDATGWNLRFSSPVNTTGSCLGHGVAIPMRDATGPFLLFQRFMQSPVGCLDLVTRAAGEGTGVWAVGPMVNFPHLAEATTNAQGTVLLSNASVGLSADRGDTLARSLEPGGDSLLVGPGEQLLVAQASVLGRRQALSLLRGVRSGGALARVVVAVDGRYYQSARLARWDGGLVAAWLEALDATLVQNMPRLHLRVAFSGDGGDSWSTPQTLSALADGQTISTVALDARGSRVVVAWDVLGADGFATGNVFVSLFP